jgi:hypothetical protein
MIANRSLWGAVAVAAASLTAVAQPPSEPAAGSRLTRVPAFLFTDSKGQPLMITPTGAPRALIGVFFTPTEAEAFAAALTKRDPKLAKELKMVIVTLAEVDSRRQSATAKDPLYTYIASTAEITAAQALLKAEGKTEKFQGVPVFIARTGQNAYLSVKEGDHNIVPAFLSWADLDQRLKQLRVDNPTLAAKVTVTATTLETLLPQLKRPENQVLQLVAPTPSLTFVRDSLKAAEPARKP